jgi:hypothetical protein
MTSSLSNTTTENVKGQAQALTDDLKQSGQSVYDDVKQRANAATQSSGSTSGGVGGNIVNSIKQMTGQREIGGNQLFGPPKGAPEGQAGHGFLNKYTGETAPSENTA